MDIFDISAISLQDMMLIIAISESGSVSYAADSVRITQSTASYRLGKLRETFNDPIFVSINRKMLPTHIGSRVISTFRNQINDFQRLIDPDVFDPATTTRKFSVISKGLFLPWMMVSLSNTFFQSASNAELAFDPALKDRNINQHLHEQGHVYTWTLDNTGAAGIRRQVSPALQVMMHYDPDYSRPPTTMDEFLKCRFISLGGARSMPSLIDKELKKLGLGPFKYACYAPTVESIAQLIAGTNLIYCGSNLFTRGFVTGLKSADVPFFVPGIRHEIRWSISKEHDQGSSWFIDLVKKVARETYSPESQVDPNEGFTTLSEFEALEEHTK